MKIVFKNNVISICNTSLDKQKAISELWVQLREDYSDWVASFRLKKIDNDKTVAESLEWRGMSSWWLSSLVARDPEQDNQWLHRLMVLYLCKSYESSIVVETDDQVLEKSIVRNFSGINIERLSSRDESIKNRIRYSYPLLFNVLKLLRSYFQHLEVYLLLAGVRRKQLSRFQSSLATIWFRSTYPANWVQDDECLWMDRHIRHAPLLDKKYDNHSAYLMFIKRYGKDIDAGFNVLRKRLKSLEDDAKREVFFPEAHLNLLDIIGCYYSSFLELKKINYWKRSNKFIKWFLINDIDVSDVLLDEWRNGYFHKIQYNKVHGLAIERFFSNMDSPQTVVTYGEFFVQSRYAYYALKRVSPGSKIVSLQHAMNVRNRMYGYYRKDEFRYGDNDINYSPRPDYYLSQGKRYVSILGEFYDGGVRVIGCLKYDVFNEIEKYRYLIKERLVEKYCLSDEVVVLLAPSIDDASDILFLIGKLCSVESVRIILRPHPATNVSDIMRMHSEICPDVEILYVSDEPTYNLFSIADLVVCGYSTVAIEAAYFGVQAVRAVRLGTFPLFDEEVLIPSFFSGDDFIQWFNDRYYTNVNANSDDIELKKLAYNYFYKIDGNTADRLWEFLVGEKGLSNNHDQ